MEEKLTGVDENDKVEDIHTAERNYITTTEEQSAEKVNNDKGIGTDRTKIR